jgi:hypothetical protein
MTAELDSPSDLFSEYAIAELIGHPGFRRAVETTATAAVEHFAGLDQHYQWLVKDMGRTSIAITALFLHSSDQGLTVSGLTAGCASAGIGSPGRVRQFLSYAYMHGQISLTDGVGHWTKRRLIFGPSLMNILRNRQLIELKGLSQLTGEVHALPAYIEDEANFLRYVLWTGALTSLRPDLFHVPSGLPMHLFNDRDAGMVILYDLMLAQKPDRTRLLEEAPISRNRLSQRFNVSRAHINKLLADGTEMGLLSCPANDRVAFTPKLSEALERQFAIHYQASRAGARAAFAATPKA